MASKKETLTDIEKPQRDAEAEPLTTSREAKKEPDTGGKPVSQDTPTKMPERDRYGFEMDGFGLPVNGPVRVAVLSELSAPDPLIDQAGWEAAGSSHAKVENAMEKLYG